MSGQRRLGEKPSRHRDRSACYRNTIAAVGLFVVLSACQTSVGSSKLTANDYELMQAALRESYTLRTQAVSECVSDYDVDGEGEELELFSGLLKVPRREVPGIICGALMDAIAIGTIDYSDFVSIERGDIDEPLAFRIIGIIVSQDQESI